MNKSFYLVIDIETKNTFSEVGAADPSKLSTSFIGIYRSDTETYEGYFEKDFDKFFDLLKTCDYVIGYNIDGFDFPVLKPICPFDIEKIPTVDLYKIAYNYSKVHLKLDNIAQTTLGEGKSGDGLSAVRYYKEGKFEELSSYCLDDVKITKMIYDYAKTNGYVKYKDGLGIVSKVEMELPEYFPKNIKEEGFGLF